MTEKKISTGSEANSSLTAFNQDLNSNILELQRRSEWRQQHQVSIIAEKMIAEMPNLSGSLLELLSQKGNTQKAVIDLLASSIVSVADGNLSVVRYSQRAKAEQEVYIFVGTHWELMRTQSYYDLIKSLCKKGGQSETNSEDPSFMNKVFENVAFRVASDYNTFIPSGEARLNLLNGTLELLSDGTAHFRPHNRDDFFLYVLPYVYNPKAECPMWEKFLSEVLPDSSTQTVVAEFVGYCFTHGIKIEKMLVLYGQGSNGKSVLMDVLEALFGISNVSFINLADLTNNDEKRSHIEHKLANISHESDKELDASYLKKIVSGEPVDARKLYVGSYTIHSYARLITAFNILPRAEVTNGFYRRFLIIPFNRTINEKEADVDLARKIIATELPGVLNWVLNVLPEFLRRRNFTESRECSEALENYKLQSDSVRLFAKECLETDVQDGQCKASELYNRYKEFCLGENLRAIGRNKFFGRMETIGIHSFETQKTKHFPVKIKNYE